MLRVHFTAEDLARTHVAFAPDPLWEMLLGSFKLHERPRPAFMRPWAQRLRDHPEWNSAIRPGIQLLGDLAPQGPYFPDFVTPAEAEAGLDAGLEAIMRTPHRRVMRELNLLASHGRSKLPAWLNLFATDTTRALTHVTTTLRRYHDVAVAPHHDLIKAGIDADRALRARHLLDGGVEGLLHGMRPLMDWQPPVLHVRYDVEHEMHLNGRGVRLVPSYFCHGSPVAIADPELPPVIIYPIAAEHRWMSAPHASQPLRELLGATRANVLSAITSEPSTTRLARILRISPAAASRHATVLRNAGLIDTHRHGSAVLHTLTPLGARLLDRTRPPNATR